MQGNKIRAEMALRGISVTELCDSTGISRASLWRKLSGATKFDTDEVKKICTVLHIDDPYKMQDLFFT